MYSSLEKTPGSTSLTNRSITERTSASHSLPAVPALQRAEKENEKEEEIPSNTVMGKFVTQLEGTEDDKEEEKPQDTIQNKFAIQQQPATEGKTSNNTGLPDNLKSGVEKLSGFDMSDVKVHYNSDKPAQLNALAYAQGTDIHVGAGQEKHVAHEAWHVAQQKQGRVEPTTQLKLGVPVNNDPALEKEADVMGAKALTEGTSATTSFPS